MLQISCLDHQRLRDVAFTPRDAVYQTSATDDARGRDQEITPCEKRINGLYIRMQWVGGNTYVLSANPPQRGDLGVRAPAEEEDHRC